MLWKRFTLTFLSCCCCDLKEFFLKKYLLILSSGVGAKFLILKVWGRRALNQCVRIRQQGSTAQCINVQVFHSLSISSVHPFHFKTIPRLPPHSTGNFCTYSDKWVDTNFTDHAWPAIDLLLGDFLPCLIIAVALVLTIAWIRRHSPVAQTVLEPYIVDLPTFKQIRQIFMCQSAMFVVLLLAEATIYLSKLASFRLEKERFNSFAYSIARSKIHSVDFSYFSNPYFVPQMLLQYFDFAFLSLKFVAFLIWCPYYRKLFIEHVQCRTRKIKIGTKLFIWRRRSQRECDATVFTWFGRFHSKALPSSSSNKTQS